MKRIILIITALCMMLCLCSCDIEKVGHFRIDNADQIELSGDSGTVYITAPDAVERMTAVICDNGFMKTSPSEPEDHVYSLTWYDADGKQIEQIFIMDENGYVINRIGMNYKVSADLSIDMDYINAVYNSIIK